jgi:hypothetical protein
MTAFSLPSGRKNWHEVQARIKWCKDRFGERKFGGPWEYNAVHHMIVIKDPKMCLLYRLRWS